MLLFFLVGCLLLSGCAAGEQPSWGEAGKSITFRVTCQENLDPNLTYRIAIDTDGNVLTGPSKDPADWQGLYVLEWKSGSAWLSLPSGASNYVLDSTFSGTTAEATVSLEALGSPDQVDVMVVVEDGGGNVLDTLSSFFTVRLKYQRFVSKSDSLGDTDNPSADLAQVVVEVTF